MGAARPASRTPGTVPGLPHPNPHGRHTEAHMEPKHDGSIPSVDLVSELETDPFEQPYWNLDQYLIWLANRDPAAVLGATDRPNSGANPPIGWRMHRESNANHQKVEMEAVRAIKDGDIKVRSEFNGEWFIPDEPEEFADWAIDFEGEPTFAALLMRPTKRGTRLEVRPRFNPQ